MKEEGLPLVCEEEHGRGEGEEGEGTAISSSYLPTPKSNARRNPWGNFSYADLITQVLTHAAIYIILTPKRWFWELSIMTHQCVMKHRTSGWFWAQQQSMCFSVLLTVQFSRGIEFQCFEYYYQVAIRVYS